MKFGRGSRGTANGQPSESADVSRETLSLIHI